MKETLLKGLTAGVVAGVGSSLLFGNVNVGLMGLTINSAFVNGGIVGLGSIASDMISDNIIESMDIPQNVKTTEELLIRTGVCGAASSAVYMLAGLSGNNIPRAFLLGAGSKLGGDYGYQLVLSPKGIIPLF